MEDLKPGDTVRLKSGGPAMTVESIGDYHGESRVACTWFMENKLQRDTFQTAALMAVNAPR